MELNERKMTKKKNCIVYTREGAARIVRTFAMVL